MSEYIIRTTNMPEHIREAISTWYEIDSEIVRCRDCRFSLAHGNGCGRNQDIYDAEPNGYCKWGERRDA